MKQHPILFSGEMVKAIIEGRKTQTRRLMKPQPNIPSTGHPVAQAELLQSWLRDHACPYGAVGDQLWVRETFAIETNFNLDDEESYPPPFKDGRPVKRYPESDDGEWGAYWEQPHYRATDPTPELDYPDNDTGAPMVKWQPSIHMPRWASRITLEIVSVRVERLDEITEDDAKAEGAPLGRVLGYGRLGMQSHREGFIDLWEQINGKRASWLTNPWVWVIEFKRIQQREDA